MKGKRIPVWRKDQKLELLRTPVVNADHEYIVSMAKRYLALHETMMQLQAELTSAIAVYRDEQGVAWRLGMSKQCVSDIRRGRRAIKLKTAKRIVEAAHQSERA